MNPRDVCYMISPSRDSPRISVRTIRECEQDGQLLLAQRQTEKIYPTHVSMLWMKIIAIVSIGSFPS